MTFDELARLLEIEGFEESPSEIHGLLCGRIAGGERLAGDDFRGALVESVDSEEELVDNALPQLEGLYREILSAFDDAGFGFQPLLPPDTHELEQRVMALASWCQSFLSGLGSAGLSDTDGLSEDALGGIKDLAAIAQAGFEGEPEEDDESDLLELQEYVRVAAMMIYAEINLAMPDVGAGSQTIH